MLKSSSSLLLFAAFSFLLSCKKESDGPSLNQPFFVKYGQTVEVPGEMTVTLSEIVEDSRCPCTADCIMEGWATVRIVGNVNGPRFNCPMLENSIKTFNGYQVQVLEILPEPCGIELPIPLEDYEVKVLVKKVG